MKKVPWRKIALVGSSLLALGAALLVVTAFWLAIEGRYRWATTKANLESRGESLTFDKLLPPAVPDSENFFAHSIWQPKPDQPDSVGLFTQELAPEEAERLKSEYPELAKTITPGNRFKTLRKIILDARSRDLSSDETSLILALSEPFQEQLGILQELASRPSARYPLDYAQGFAVKLPHLVALLRTAEILAFRAKANAALADYPASVRDILLILRLAATLENEPLAISQLVEASMDSIALDLIEKQIPNWNSLQAESVDKALLKIALHQQLRSVLRGERAFANSFFDNIEHSTITEAASTLAHLPDHSSTIENPVEFPSSPAILTWLTALTYRSILLDGDRAYLNEAQQRWIDLLEPQPTTLRPNLLDSVNSQFDAPAEGLSAYRHALTTMTTHAVSGIFSRAAYVQSRVGQAVIACAIQRYALVQRRLPSALSDLKPDFIQSIPNDLIDGAPMRYRSEGDRYRLWSIGWNLSDENGEADSKNRKSNVNGDWVWEGRLPSTR